MTLRKGLPAKLAATDANDTRYDFNNLVVCNADGSPRGGVTAPLTALVSSSATMNVAVAAFSAVAVRDGGVVLLANDGPVNVLLTAAPPANSRIDVIYAKQNDASSTVTTPDANNNAVIDKVTGTASASPSKPAIPTGAVELATVLVPSTATATNSAGVVITQTAQFTAGPGGNVPFRTKTDLDAWTTAASGQEANVFADPNPALIGSYVFRGSWKKTGAAVFAAPSAVLAGPIPPVGAPLIEQLGVVTVSTSAGGDVTLNFPAAFPNGLLTVQLQRQGFGTFGVTIEIGSDVVPPTLSAFVFRVFASNGTPVASATGIKYSYTAIGW